MKKQAHWLAGIMATMTVLAAGCGGVAQKPAVPASPTVYPTAAAPAETQASQPAAVRFEIIAESMLPPELAPWREAKSAPDSARVGDFVYVLVMGGDATNGAAAIVPTQVELVEKPSPVFSVHAVVTPGTPSAGGNSARAYLRIPYAASLPVPGVQTRMEWQTVQAEAAPATKPAAPPATPVTPPPVTNPAPPVAAPPQEPATPAVPAPPSGSITVTPIPENALPASLAAWKASTVQVPNGVGQYAEGALYLMVSGGQRNSGGYAVEIRSVSLSGSAIRVSAVLHRPKPGSMVTQAITYPRAYARVNLTGTGAVQVIVDWQ